jgi:hypothetical protein
MKKLWGFVVVVVLAGLTFLIGCWAFCCPRRENLVILQDCVYAHSEDGLDYPWLGNIHGGLHKIQFEEPPNSGKWEDYTDKVWDAHCTVVDHSPGKLVGAHVKAFIDPLTRFAKLHFHFRDGTVMEPTRKFYELEDTWFAKH